MYVVHGTRKFLERVGAPARAEVGHPTTVLGDWYATVLFWKPQVGLFVNETTLLPVLLPFAPAATVIDRFPRALATVLRGHGIGEAFVEDECAAMADYLLAKTKNRSVVGMMTEFAFLGGATPRRRTPSTSSNCHCGWPARRAGRCTAAKAVPTANWLPTSPDDSAELRHRSSQDGGRRDVRDRSVLRSGSHRSPRRGHG